MKNLSVRLVFFISSLFLSSMHVIAQTSFRDKIRTVFQNVDKTQATTHFIKECGYPFLALDRFNGAILADTTLMELIKPKLK